MKIPMPAIVDPVTTAERLDDSESRVPTFPPVADTAGRVTHSRQSRGDSVTDVPPVQGDETLVALLRVLPVWVRDMVVEFGVEDLEEVALDLGRPLTLQSRSTHRIMTREIAKADLHYVVHRVSGFREDDRTGIDRTVHRIACIRDRYGSIVGLTIRIGRAIPGSADVIRDLLHNGRSTLLVGAPGSGKTTILRDAARILSDRWGPRAIVVDTSNEIGGDGRIPHPSIGQARRVQVPEPSAQGRILMQALANHGPRALVIDELGFHMDVAAALTIARRGVQMIATAHGGVLQDVVDNPDLAPLVGGIVLTGNAQRRRMGRPAFGQVVEVRDRAHVLVHHDVARSVDQILAGQPPDAVELRVRTP